MPNAARTRPRGALTAIVCAGAWAAAGAPLGACGGGETPAPPGHTDASPSSGRDGPTADRLGADQPPAPDAGPERDQGQAPPFDAGAGAAGDTAPPASDAPATAADAAAGCGACTAWGEPQLLGRIQAAGLNALSGMAASWRNPGVVYVHNDRDRPEFYAVSEAGALLGRFTLAGATVRDIEDMAVSRCPAGTCVYVADIGNNVSPRTEFAIYRAAEPAVDLAGPGGDASLPAERFAFSYADGAHNAESLLIEAATGSVYIITKEAAGAVSAAYRLETFEPGRSNRAVKVATLPVPAAGDQPATSANAHPCGAGFLLRTNNRLYEFRTPPGASLADALAVAPVAVPVGNEVQGEAVSYRPDGRGYYTTSEGAGPPLHRVTCR
jgi:hypothetical protein